MNHQFELTLMVSPRIATKYGLPVAVVIAGIEAEQQHYSPSGLNQYDGRTWFCGSDRQMKIYFPFFEKDELDSILEYMIDNRILDTITVGELLENNIRLQEVHSAMEEGNYNIPIDMSTPYFAFAKRDSEKGE